MDALSDYVHTKCLRELCVERCLKKSGLHGQVMERLLFWKKPVKMTLQGWTSSALLYKFQQNQLLDMCRERHLLQLSGGKSALAQKLMTWKAGPFEDLSDWTEEQLVKRCTKKELKTMLTDRNLVLTGHSAEELALRLIEDRDYSSEEESEDSEAENEEEAALLSVRKQGSKHKKSSSSSSSRTPAGELSAQHKKDQMISAKKSPVWKQVWRFLKGEGWTWANGTNLVAFYYLKPGVRTKANGVLGSTMFASEDAVIASLSDVYLKMAMESPISREKTRKQMEKDERAKRNAIWNMFLKDEKGWYYANGSKLVDWYYVRPGVKPADFKHMVNVYHSVDEVIKGLTTEVRRLLGFENVISMYSSCSSLLFFCSSVLLFVCLSVCLFVCLSVLLFFCSSVLLVFSLLFSRYIGTTRGGRGI